MNSRLARGAGPERGAIAGIEALSFGMLLFVAGTLFIANIWAVIDAKLAVTSAAREATRAFVEADDGASARVYATAGRIASASPSTSPCSTVPLAVARGSRSRSTTAPRRSRFRGSAASGVASIPWPPTAK